MIHQNAKAIHLSKTEVQTSTVKVCILEHEHPAVPPEKIKNYLVKCFKESNQSTQKQKNRSS